MDVVSYSHSAKQAQRIEKFIANPDSASGIVTVPKVIEAGESVTVPAGRVAVLPNVQVDGELVVESDGDVFIPAWATLSKVVELEGDQTIAGVKTFSSSPIVPTPTAGNQVVNKAYADLKVALADFIGANQSLFVGDGFVVGYQKLPGGLIIQWGAVDVTSSLVVNLPISYPNSQLFNIAGDRSGGTPIKYLGTNPGTKTNFTIYTTDSGLTTATWLSIGY